jgi:hypothetical protein
VTSALSLAQRMQQCMAANVALTKSPYDKDPLMKLVESRCDVRSWTFAFCEIRRWRHGRAALPRRVVERGISSSRRRRRRRHGGNASETTDKTASVAASNAGCRGRLTWAG